MPILQKLTTNDLLQGVQLLPRKKSMAVPQELVLRQFLTRRLFLFLSWQTKNFSSIRNSTRLFIERFIRRIQVIQTRPRYRLAAKKESKVVPQCPRQKFIGIKKPCCISRALSFKQLDC